MDDFSPEAFQEEMRETLEEIARYRMPFGKYGPEKFPPNGIPIYDLPWEYLHWFSQRGFPKSRLGELLEVVYHMKGDGSDQVFNAFRKKSGGRHSLREPKTRNREFPET